MTQEALKLALEALENNKLNHLYCEDTWYSCPKHEDGCANEAEGDECNCGADEVNAQFDNAITAIKEALAQTEQEPVAWMSEHRFDELRKGFTVMTTLTKQRVFEDDVAIYTTPPQRKPLTDEEKADLFEGTAPYYNETDYADAIEAKLKQKNGYAEENT